MSKFLSDIFIYIAGQRMVVLMKIALPEEYQKFRYLWEKQDVYYFIRTGVVENGG